MSIILKPFALLLGWFYTITNSYGLAVILFCLVFKIILFPISIKGRKGMLDMSRLAEKQKELQQKYGRDRTRYSEELQQLYVNENVKPSSGCLWSFLPLPLLFALYGIVSQPFTHLMGLKADQVSALTTLISEEGAKAQSQLALAQPVYERFGEVSAKLPEIATQITNAGGPISFDFFGLNLSATPDLLFFQKADPFNWVHIGLFLIPIISAILAVMSMKVNMHINKKILNVGNSGQSDTMNRQMLFVQPILSLWIGFTLPAALGLYWISNSLFGIVQEYCSINILKKHMRVTKEKALLRTEEQKDKMKEQKRLAAEQKKKKAEEARRIKMERSLNTDGIADSRVGMRTYARGRTYDATRYEVTNYRDPDDIIKEQREAQNKAAAQQQEEKAQPRKKGKKKQDDVELPAGMVLNESVRREPLVEERVAEEPALESEEKTED